MRRIVAVCCGASIVAGCGRIGFDPNAAAGDGGPIPAECSDPAHASSASAPIVLTPGIARDTLLCAGEVAWFVLSPGEGTQVAASLDAVATPALVGVELINSDGVIASRSIWGASRVSTAAIATTTGGYELRVDSTSAIAQTFTLTATLTPPIGHVYHIAPDGNDASIGDAAAAWATWQHAYNQLAAGDMLIVENGTWTDGASCAGLVAPCAANATMPAAFCDGLGNAPPGTPALPVTIIARDERQAHLVGAGATHSFLAQNCPSWVVDGLHASSADFGSAGAIASPFFFLDDDSLVVRHLLADHPNRCGDNPALAVDSSANALIEDCEAYDFHIAGIYAADGSGDVLRRDYVNSRDTPEIACSLPTLYPTRGDTGLDCYHGSSPTTCIMESSVVEDVVAGYSAPDNAGWAVTSVAAIDTNYGFLVKNSTTNPTTTATLADFACVNCDIGIDNRGLPFVVTGATLVGGQARLENGTGLAADDAGGTIATTTATNVLALDNAFAGFYLTDQQAELITNANAFGSPQDYESVAEPIDDNAGDIQASLSVAPTGMGQAGGQCLVYVPPTSNMHGAGAGGADLGANLIVRQQNGSATDEKLWDQRTGAFPCGAIVAGVNDVAGASCFDVHTRLNVGTPACPIP